VQDRDKLYWRDAKKFVKNLLPLACTRKGWGGDALVAAEPGLFAPDLQLAAVGVMGGAQWAWIVAAKKLGWKEPQP